MLTKACDVLVLTSAAVGDSRDSCKPVRRRVRMRPRFRPAVWLTSHFQLQLLSVRIMVRIFIRSVILTLPVTWQTSTKRLYSQYNFIESRIYMLHTSTIALNCCRSEITSKSYLPIENWTVLSVLCLYGISKANLGGC